MISGTIITSEMKLCTVTVLRKTFQNKKKYQKSSYDVTMTSLLKQWENPDLRETEQIIYHSKGNGKLSENV